MNYKIISHFEEISMAPLFRVKSLSEKCDSFCSLMIVSKFNVFHIVAVIYLIPLDTLQITENDNLMALLDFFIQPFASI